MRYLYTGNGVVMRFVTTKCRQTGEIRVGCEVVSIIKETPPVGTVLSVAMSQPEGCMTLFGVKIMACPVGGVFLVASYGATMIAIVATRRAGRRADRALCDVGSIPGRMGREWFRSSPANTESMSRGACTR